MSVTPQVNFGDRVVSSKLPRVVEQVFKHYPEQLLVSRDREVPGDGECHVPVRVVLPKLTGNGLGDRAEVELTAPELAVHGLGHGFKVCDKPR